jgi:subtilisin family serine protease
MMRKSVLIAALLLAGILGFGQVVNALDLDTGAMESAISVSGVADAASAVEESDGPADPVMSHRLIVELESPPIVEWAQGRTDEGLWNERQQLDVDAPAARQYERQLQMEQDAFVKQLKVAIPGARVATFINEFQTEEEARYTILLNGLSIEAGLDADLDQLEAKLRELPGVKEVYRDYAHQPTLYASVPLIDAPAIWNSPQIGGMENAGAGVKFASVDGGILAEAAMFDGEGYEYPVGYPLGYVANTNGKVIVSRVYFRTWDPPAPGDEFAFPGERGTSHGQHTSSTAVGNHVTADYNGVEIELTGVAPRAYAMSYRVFYYSTQGIGSVYSTESIAALEDVVRDKADVVNNSWGGGSYGHGAPGDATDQALVNCWKAGIFVSMSNGNSGPKKFSGDHPSPEYINVGNTTTTGRFVTDGINVTAPEPVSDTLKHLAMEPAAFGDILEGGKIYGPYPYVSGQFVNPENFEGCEPWPEGAFEGKAAVISRGACEFGKKVYYAQEAGAQFVVIHNDEARGDALVRMSGGEFGISVTIGATFVGYTSGMKLTDWQAAHPEEAQLNASTQVYQAGNVPDVLVGGSSRGPATTYRLDPDIAAPGTNILAQGYGDGPGIERHMGYGQASGTSMASPHVAGAAALLRQVHPEWPNDYIKSALMSTSKYMDVYLDSAHTIPAQPLDMGAGRLNLTHATDPGVILDPPLLSYGLVKRGKKPSIEVAVTNVYTEAETYQLSSLDTSGGFTETVEVAGLSFEPESVTIEPGETVTVTVTWDTTAVANEYDDNQGYLVLAGEKHEAHMPAWIRVAYPKKLADVLLLDNDGSSLDYEIREAFYGEGNVVTFTNYITYYTDILDTLGYTYEVLDYDAITNLPALMNGSQQLPDANELLQYGNILHFTGDNPLPTLNNPDLDQLHEFVTQGHGYVGFGQDLSSVLRSNNPDDPDDGTSFFLSDNGVQFLQDSINAEQVFTTTVQPLYGVRGSPFAGLALDMSATGDGAGNQVFVDELRPNLSPNQTFDQSMMPLLLYPGPTAKENGYVAARNYGMRSLERPVLSWWGRTAYFGFGLEGINDDTGYLSRLELGERALGLVMDEATATISATVNAAHQETFFEAYMDSTHGGDAVTLRWDFGDGTPYTDVWPVQKPEDANDPPYNAGHIYARPGEYTVRVEATNELGTTAIGVLDIVVGEVLPESEYIDRWSFIFVPFTSKLFDFTAAP